MHAIAAPNEITVPQLLRLIGTPDAPVLVDISINPDFDDDLYLIPGSFRHPPTDLAGLLALSVGLSRQYRDDLRQIKAGMVICDALYRWARDRMDEGHDWPADNKA